jgi:hypothetical protein
LAPAIVPVASIPTAVVLECMAAFLLADESANRWKAQGPFSSPP